MDGCAETNAAVLSRCKTWRYRLDRFIGAGNLTIAYFGINPSIADSTVEDQTTRKLSGFAAREGARRYVLGNPFAFRATNVRELAIAGDPVGPANDEYLRRMIAEADILVPCWGATSKVPRNLRWRIEKLWNRLLASGKPVMVFGYTHGRDQSHPLMLPYATRLQQVSASAFVRRARNN